MSRGPVISSVDGLSQPDLHVAGTVTAQDYGNLKFYVQHAAASYCNMDKKAGEVIKCDNNCPGVEGNNVTIVSTFV